MIVDVRWKADKYRKEMRTMERIKKIVFMTIGYMALFACISWISAILKQQPFVFDIYLNLIGPILCAIATEFVPKPNKK